MDNKFDGKFNKDAKDVRFNEPVKGDKDAKDVRFDEAKGYDPRDAHGRVRDDNADGVADRVEAVNEEKLAEQLKQEAETREQLRQESAAREHLKGHQGPYPPKPEGTELPDSFRDAALAKGEPAPSSPEEVPTGEKRPSLPVADVNDPKFFRHKK